MASGLGISCHLTSLDRNAPVAVLLGEKVWEDLAPTLASLRQELLSPWRCDVDSTPTLLQPLCGVFRLGGWEVFALASGDIAKKRRFCERAMSLTASMLFADCTHSKSLSTVSLDIS